MRGRRAVWTRVLTGVLAATSTWCALEAQVPLVIPSAIAFDAQGDLYFSDVANHLVRKFSTSGAAETVAGTGVQGFSGDGGVATAAELDSPGGLAIDAAGDLFIADTHNHRVRKINASSGTITTVAGTGAAGYSGDGGLATAARLDAPAALAVDEMGNLFLADTGNHRVRRIAVATGVIATVAGDGVEGFAGDGGQATAAEIDSPNGLSVDAAGNLYIGDTHNQRVRKVSAATGLITTVAGATAAQNFGGDGGAATAAGLALPRGITIDAAGNVYLADAGNHRIRRISAAGVITTVAGQGVEGFAGDDAPAVAATLDSPRDVAVSPAGLLTLTDSANQRIRQLDALPAPGPNIHTLSGVASITATTVTLSGPSTAVYGTAVTVTATVSSAGNATGIVTFSDASGAQASPLGTTTLSGGAATFTTAVLEVGLHSVVADYAGDGSHGAARSSGLALMVTPLSLSAKADPVLIQYGQAVPPLSGTVNGVLAQDAGKVVATFSSSAGLLSPPGVYPISVALLGTAAANYSVGSTAGSVTIGKASVVLTVSPSTSNAAIGVPVTLNVQAASTTTGTPTGSVTLMDGGAVLGLVPLSAGGASFSTSALASGTHNLSAVYPGDTNFLGGTSGTAVVTIGGGADFTLASTGATSQSVPAGSAAVFNFAVAMQGGVLSSPITLAVQGLPVGATASLNPVVLPPGGSVTSFTLTIQTPIAELKTPSRSRPWGGSPVLALVVVPLVGALSRKRYRGSRLLLLAVASGLLCATGCGNRINTATETIDAKTYTLTVTGTATSSAGTPIQHSTTVTLTVL